MERCEQCSIRMHCMACRKSLCASCAFNRPLPRKRAKTRHFGSLSFGAAGLSAGSASDTASTTSNDSRQSTTPKRSRFWWAPGAARSPNLLNETSEDDDSSDSDDSNINHGTITFNHVPPKLNMQWCCIEPIFSGGGGIAVLGSGVGGSGASRIRAVPLPKGQGYEDPDFRGFFDDPPSREGKQYNILEYVTGADIDVASYLQQDTIDLQASVCPRSLCQDCHKGFRWKVTCRGCKKPLCKEHDFRGLKVRKCGFRSLNVERDYVRSHPATTSHDMRIPSYRPINTPSDLPPSYQESQESNSMMRSTSSTPRPPPHMDFQQQQNTPFNMAMGLSERLSGRMVPFSTRPRSHSVSGMRGRLAANHSWMHTQLAQSPFRTPITDDRVPLPCSYGHPVQWQGCGGYFCLSDRAAGDCRPRCTAQMRECGECSVLVCEVCSYNMITVQKSY